jgi:hypothetical protein
MFREGPARYPVLCNACALRWKRHGMKLFATPVRKPDNNLEAGKQDTREVGGDSAGAEAAQDAAGRACLASDGGAHSDGSCSGDEGACACAQDEPAHVSASVAGHKRKPGPHSLQDAAAAALAVLAAPTAARPPRPPTSAAAVAAAGGMRPRGGSSTAAQKARRGVKEADAETIPFAHVAAPASEAPASNTTSTGSIADWDEALAAIQHAHEQQLRQHQQLMLALGQQALAMAVSAASIPGSQATCAAACQLAAHCMLPRRTLTAAGHRTGQAPAAVGGAAVGPPNTLPQTSRDGAGGVQAAAAAAAETSPGARAQASVLQLAATGEATAATAGPASC